MIAESSTGTDFLRSEIRSSEGRLAAVKSGIPVSVVVPAINEEYFTPQVDQYYRGYDKVLRDKDCLQQMRNQTNLLSSQELLSNKRHSQAKLSSSCETRSPVLARTSILSPGSTRPTTNRTQAFQATSDRFKNQLMQKVKTKRKPSAEPGVFSPTQNLPSPQQTMSRRPKS